MTDPFFSADEMLALQEAALPGMQTDIQIYAAHQTTSDAISAGNDYGDDVLTYAVVTDPDNTSEPLIVKGWLFQQVTPVATEDASQITTVNTVRLYVPLGTPIRVGDEVRVPDELGDVQAYTVADTNADITWKAWITCSLRELE